MWNDINNNRDFLEGNKIVHSLIEGAVDWDCTIPEEVDQEEAYLPVTADASQLHAINMAAAGVSFVLHGPPGTGKSQTITALIANALFFFWQKKELHWKWYRNVWRHLESMISA